MEVLEQINNFLANNFKQSCRQIMIQARVDVSSHKTEKRYSNITIQEVFDEAYEKVEKLFLEEWEIYKKNQ